MNNRVLGYLVILFLIVFLLVPVVSLTVRFLSPEHHRTIVFEKVNTLSFLRNEDPVRIRGFEVGKVRAITWKENKTHVDIETKSELQIHEGYRVMAEDKGFMGDRYVAIYPGEASRPLVNKMEILRGSYLMGPTEAVAYIGKLEVMVDSATKIAHELRYGSPGGPSLAARFSSVMRRLDTITVGLAHLLLKTNRLIDGNADSLAAFTEKVRSLSDKLGFSIPETIGSVESAAAKTGKLIMDVDSLVTSIGVLVDRLQSKDAIALNEKCRKLKHRLQALRDAVNELRRYGLTLPVKLR